MVLLLLLLVIVYSLSSIQLFCNPMDCSPPGSSVHEIFFRQEHLSELSFPSPGDLPNPGIKPTSLALAGGFFTTESPGDLYTS